MTRPIEKPRTSAEQVTFDADGPIAWLTFNRPEALNALTWPMYERIFDLCERFDSDDALRVLVLRGAGERAFVAGADISQFDDLRGEAAFRSYSLFVDRTFRRLAETRKPTIALIRGACVGGGAMLAVAADIRIAASDARFGVPAARTLGNGLSVESLARLVAVLGDASTTDLTLTGRLIDAEEGRRLGLYSEVVKPAALEERVRETATAIARNAPLAVRAIKEGLRRLRRTADDDPDHELEMSSYLSEDFREGVRAFLEKRPPAWRGR